MRESMRKSFVEQYRSKPDPSQDNSNNALRIISKSPSIKPAKEISPNISFAGAFSPTNAGLRNSSNLQATSPSAISPDHPSGLRVAVYQQGSPAPVG